MGIKDIKIKDESGAFNFEGNSNTFIEALNRVMDVTGYVSKVDTGRFHIGVSFKKKFYIIGYSDETYCVVKVDGFTTDKDGCVLFLEPDRIKVLFKGRGEIKFTYDGNLMYKAGKFSGNVVCNNVSAEQLPRVKQILKSGQAETNNISYELLQSIRKGVRLTNITDKVEEKSLLCYINYSKGQLIVSNFDKLHLAHYEDEIKDGGKGSFKMALPANMFNVVDKFLDGDTTASFQMNSSAFGVVSDNFIVGFPPVQTEDGNFDLTKNYLKMLEKPVCSFTLGKEFKDAQASLKSLISNDENYVMAIGGKSIKLSLSTDFGAGSDTFKVNDLVCKEDKLKIRLDHRILGDLISIIGIDTIPFSLFKRNGKIQLYTMKNILATNKKKAITSSLVLIGSINQ